MRKRDLALRAGTAAARSPKERRDESLRAALSTVREALDLSFDQMGRVFHVSGETARRWETGVSAIPEAHWAAITTLSEETKRLQQLFEPDRLPLVIRRPAEMFSGSVALDWIFAGRVQEIADLYEAALLYQA